MSGSHPASTLNKVVPTALPRPRTLDPMTAPTLRWGVMGTGWIAERFVKSVQRHTRQRIVAVASRDSARAKTSAQALDIARPYGSYAALAADPDVVYVAVGHTEHLACARIALEHDNHALVEQRSP